MSFYPLSQPKVKTLCIHFLSDGLLNTPDGHNVTIGRNVRIGWVDDNAANVLTYIWSFKAVSASTFQTILTRTSGTVTSIHILPNVVYVAEATIDLLSVTSVNTGTYRCTVVYNIGQRPMSDFGEVFITVQSKFYFLF